MMRIFFGWAEYTKMGAGCQEETPEENPSRKPQIKRPFSLDDRQGYCYFFEREAARGNLREGGFLYSSKGLRRLDP